MKTITVGQLVLVAVLSQSVIGCLSGGGGGGASSEASPSNPVDGVTRPQPSNGIVDSEPLPEVVAGQPALTKLLQVNRMNPNDGYVDIEGTDLDQVQSVELIGVRTGTVTLVSVASQTATSLVFDVSPIPEESEAVKIRFVDQNNQRIETGRILLNSSLPKSMDNYAGQSNASLVLGGCMVMGDTSLQCFGRNGIVQYQGTQEMKPWSFTPNPNNFLHAITQASEFLQYDEITNTISERNVDSSYFDFKSKGNHDTRAFVIRDGNGNPVVNVAEVVVEKDAVCYRKLDNSVFCYGSLETQAASRNSRSLAGIVNSLLLLNLPMDYDLVKSNIVIPQAVVTPEGAAFKASKIGKQMGRVDFNNTMGLLAIEEGTQFIKKIDKVGVANDLNYGQPVQAVDIKNGLIKYSATEFGDAQGGKGKTTLDGVETAFYAVTESFLNGTSDRRSFAVSADRTKIYSYREGLNFASSNLIYTTGPGELILDIKVNSASACFRDSTNRIKCLGSKAFAGFNIAAGQATQNMFFNRYVGYDTGVGSDGTIVTNVWDIGSFVGADYGVKFWGINNSGTKEGAGITANDSARTEVSSATILTNNTNMENLGRGKTSFAVIPESIVFDYSVPQ